MNFQYIIMGGITTGVTLVVYLSVTVPTTSYL